MTFKAILFAFLAAMTASGDDAQCPTPAVDGAACPRVSAQSASSEAPPPPPSPSPRSKPTAAPRSGLYVGF